MSEQAPVSQLQFWREEQGDPEVGTAQAPDLQIRGSLLGRALTVLHLVASGVLQGQPDAAEPSVGQPGISEQDPEMQIFPGAHGIAEESGTFPVTEQTDTPVEQLVWPVLHTSPLGVQAVPAVQLTQLPPLHTRLVPQAVPLSWFVPRSVHTGVPAEQLRLPLWQDALVGTQADPLLQATQAPPLHT
jgi:hypothetical protein